jgi:hypothetical protein
MIFITLPSPHCQIYIPKSPTPHSQNIAQLSSTFQAMDCLYELQAARNYNLFSELPNSFKKIFSMLNLLPQKTQIGLRKLHVLVGILEHR